MTEVILSVEQARFVAYLVAKGRYRDGAEVVAAALAALERLETEQDALVAPPAAEPPDGCDPLRGKVWLAPDMAAAPDELIDLMGGGGR
jgi:Bacterial antitoxin of ParD toxin-antitoxin type II system and RHH